MNTNLIHNILNMLIVLIPALAAFDWTAFFDAQTACQIVGALGLAKIFINVIRDGMLGLYKRQPPVQ